MNKQNFISNNVYVLISHYAYWLITLNTLFIVTNLPFIFALLFLKVQPANSIYYLISLLPMGASLNALIACIHKLMIDRDLQVVKDYFYFYRELFLRGSLIWFISLIVLIILVIDLTIFMHTDYIAVATPPLIIFIILVSSMLLCGMVLTVKFTFSLREIIQLSFYFSIKKGYLVILNVILFGTFLFVAFMRPGFGLFVLPSVIFFIVMKNSQFIFVNQTVMKGG